MITERIPEIQNLSPEEKLLLVSELWDDLSSHPSTSPSDPELIQLLDQRVKDFRQNPDQYTTWEDAKARIRASRK